MREHNVINPFLLWCIITGMFYTSLLIIDYSESQLQQELNNPTQIEYREFP